MVGDEPAVKGLVGWSDPPVKAFGTGVRHEPIAEALKAKPGEWGEIGPYKDARASSQIAYCIREAKLPAYAPKGAFEATGRKGMVFARYVGEPDA